MSTNDFNLTTVCISAFITNKALTVYDNVNKCFDWKSCMPCDKILFVNFNNDFTPLFGICLFKIGKKYN